MNTSGKYNQTFEECLEENFGRTIIECNRCYNLQETPFWQLYGHVIITGLIIIISLIGNILYFVLLLKFKKLRNRAAIISVSVILANTGLVLSFHIQVMLSTVFKGWVFEFLGCQIFGFFSTQFILTRWLSMGVLALDRFCAAKYPFSYPKHCKVVSVILLSSSWIIPILLSAVTLQGYASVVFRHNMPSCLFYAPTVDRGMLYFSFVFTACFLLGGTLPVVLYSWLFYKAMKFRNSTVCVGTITVNNSTQSILRPQDMQDRASSERKAIVTFALIFIAFCLTGAPIYVFQMMRWISIDIWCMIPHLVHFRTIELFLSATAIDPFLVMRDRDVRKRLKHLLCCYNCGKYYSNRSDICPDLPPERNFDAIRSVASRTLALCGSRDNLDNPQSAEKVSHHHRSGSSPTYLNSLRAPVKLSSTTEGAEKEIDKELNMDSNISIRENVEASIILED